MKVFVSRKRAKTVRDLAQARITVLLHIANTGLGTRRGNRFHGGKVIDDDGKHVATVTVNGTVWPAESWREDMKPILCADGTKPKQEG